MSESARPELALREGELRQLVDLLGADHPGAKRPAPGVGEMLAERSTGEDDEQEATSAYADLADWVYLELAQLVERRVRADGANVLEGRSNVRWCASWWRHPEVVSRLTAMWHAWEELRQDPGTGMSVWWRDHFDPHWAVLTSEIGPMSRCNAAKCDGAVAALPIVAPPPDWEPPVS